MTDWGVVAARFLQYGPALVLFGAPLFCLYGLDASPVHQQSPSLHVPRPALVAAGVLAFAGAVWWVVAETAAIFFEPGQFGLNAIWTVLTGTGFGRAAFLRIALIGACLVCAILVAPRMRLWAIQAALGGAVVASFAWTGHGIEGEGLPGLIHLGADIIHLLAAAVWIGALLALAVVTLQSIRIGTGQSAGFAYHALKAFSGVGTAAVALLILSGIVNSWFLVGPRHIGQLFTTPYGGLLAVKLILFSAMLALAAANQFRLNSQLGAALRNRETVNQPLVALRRSILTETVLGLLVLVVVSWMGTLEPPMSGG